MSTELIFSSGPVTGLPVHLVFGSEDAPSTTNIDVLVEVDGDGTVLISGDGLADIEITAEGTAEIVDSSIIYGDGLADVTVDSVGEATYGITGFESDILVDVESVGTACYNLAGDSDIPIDVESVGVAAYDIFGDSDIPIDVESVGEGFKNIDGVAENTPITVLCSGTGVWTGGPEIFGDSNTSSIVINMTGDARLLLPRYGVGNNIVSIGHVGDGSVQYDYSEIVGDGTSFIDVFGETFGDLDDGRVRDTFLIDPVVTDYTAVSFDIYMVVNVDTKQYEIRSVKSNKAFLQSFRQSKWMKTLQLGTDIKDEFTITENPLPSYKTERHTTLRKYGASEINLTINITDKYRFIKNEVNIARLVDREVTRALLDTYALYELEFE